MDDESGESMELMEKCHSQHLVRQNWREYCVVDREKHMYQW